MDDTDKRMMETVVDLEDQAKKFLLKAIANYGRF